MNFKCHYLENYPSFWVFIYIKEMLNRFGMEDCKPVITPMQTSCKLSKDDGPKSTDQRQYRSMIGSLLYVTTSRPDVMQAVG